MRTITICFLFSMLIIGHIGCKNDIRIKKIIINCIDWDIDSPIRILCSDLISYNKSLKTINTNNTDFCRKIENELELIVEEKTSGEPDVRIKLDIFFNDESKSELCIGNNKVIEYDGKIIRYNEQLVSIIKDFIANIDNN